MFEEGRVGGPDGHFSLCCCNGKLKYFWVVQDGQDRPECPEPLHHLLVARAREAKHFQANIRAYNAALSFVSFGATLELPPGASLTGPPVCVVHGAVLSKWTVHPHVWRL